MALALVQTVLTVVLADLTLGIRVRWDLLPLLLVSVVIGTMGWAAFYSIFALTTRRNDVFNAVTSIFYFVFLFASSIFYPLETLPTWFRFSAYVNPITWQVDVMRYATIGVGEPRTLLLETVAFIAFTIASFWFCIRALRHQE